MKPFNTVKNIFVAATIASALTWQASGTIAYQNPAGNYGNQLSGANDPDTFQGYALGMAFTVGANPLTVTALGAFDNNQDGWSSPISVAIYDKTLQTIVGSSVNFFGIAGANLGTLGSDGGSRFLSVTPFTLAAGGTYMVVAAGYGGPNEGFEQNYNYQHGPPYTTLTQSSDITPLASAYSRSVGSTLMFPLNPYLPPDAFAAGTFEYVPEASQFAMAGIGLLGLVYIGRAYALKTKLA